MNRVERKLKGVGGVLAALAGEARELGATAGLTGTAVNVREVFRPRLLSMAMEIFGPGRTACAAIDERIAELSESRRSAEQQVAGYLSQRLQAGGSALPGWRRGFTVIALAGLIACGLSAAGRATGAWLIAVACLTVLAMVNAASFEQAAQAFTRWVDYRRARRRCRRTAREIRKLQKARFQELDRQLRVESWIEQQLAWLEASYQVAFKFAQSVRGGSRAAAA